MADNKLALLKQKLQMLTNANDDLISQELKSAEAAMKREGIVDDGSDDYEACVIDYAYFLYEKRNTGDKLPRNLRWRLNNLLFSQKIQGGLS